MTRRNFLTCLAASIGSRLVDGIAWSQLGIPDPTVSFRRFQLIYGNTHSHTSFSDAEGPGNSPQKIINANQGHLDGIILTDHAEHLNNNEWIEEGRIAQNNKLCLRGFEITGTDELALTSTKNPAYQHGWGHIIVVNTPSFAGRMIFGDGNPPKITKTFNDFLAWLASNPEGMGIFAHPDLYMIEESFNGFAAPPNITTIDRMVGCELSSHGLKYSGLDNGKELRSSNEACYRQLLRRGWRVGAYMGGDEHLPPYGKAKTVTGFYLTELSSAGMLEAMRTRRTFATEDPTASISIVGQSQSDTVIMGETLDISNAENIFHVRCKSAKSNVGNISLVFVSTKDAFYDSEITSQLLTNRDEHWGTITPADHINKYNFCCVYGKAKLKNGKQLISSPIWLRTH